MRHGEFQTWLDYSLSQKPKTNTSVIIYKRLRLWRNKYRELQQAGLGFRSEYDFQYGYAGKYHIPINK